MKFSIKDFFSKFPADLVTFTEEILNGKLHFLCSVVFKNKSHLTFTCSKTAIETLEKGVRYDQS